MDMQQLRDQIFTELEGHPHMSTLLTKAFERPALPTAIVHPVTDESLAGAVAAHRLGLITATLVGPEQRIRQCAEDYDIDLSGLTIVSTEHSHQSAAEAVALVHKGEVRALMKGGLSTDEMLSAILNSDTGIRTGRRISHVFYLDIPLYHKPLLMTDAAINIQPDLKTKRDIVINAIELAQALGTSTPKVALLSAVEKVKPEIPGTIDAAALCKMADRGQIKGGLLDGPLAFDNAISREAADTKGIESDVAGDADIMVAPDLEAGNILAKQLIYLGNAVSAGLLLGARVPVMLTSRAEKVQGRLLSCALAQAAANGGND
jgi:phosphotransacetylase